MNFTELGLEDVLLRAVQDMGFVTPTEIQAKTIPYILSSRNDLIALAQTGTGKTAAFSLPVLQQIQADNDAVQMLVLCPTRELALQIHRDMEEFLKYKKLRLGAIYGGDSMTRQLRLLKERLHVVVGTPGRVADMLRREKLDLSQLQWLVLDEADEMLSMGFKDELDFILGHTPQSKQTLLFSATIQPEIERIAQTYMHEPHELRSGQRNEATSTVQHLYTMVHAKDKFTALTRFVDLASDMYAIVFCRTRMETQEVADKLGQAGYDAEPLHGDLSQAQREQVMNRFRRRQTTLLVATDVAARGIDVDDLTHVIHFQLPDSVETYIHRSGRTGRAGKSGIAISLIHTREKGKMKMIEKKIKGGVEYVSVPMAEEILTKRLERWAENLKNYQPRSPRTREALPSVLAHITELTREELLSRLLDMEIAKMNLSTNAEDINVQPYGNEKGKKEKGRDRFEHEERRSFDRPAAWRKT